MKKSISESVDLSNVESVVQTFWKEASIAEEIGKIKGFCDGKDLCFLKRQK